MIVLRYSEPARGGAGGKAIADVVSETEEERANFAFFTD
jgi:hypothetical protein